uniref:Uncharacterized protein n=1 Tax=Romanomermis culicivorax TaxID=13658 RepID=A0A915LAX7_ROMCU
MDLGPKLCGYLLLLPASSKASLRPSLIVSPLALALGLASILALVLASLASTASAKQFKIHIVKLCIRVLALALPVSLASVLRCSPALSCSRPPDQERKRLEAKSGKHPHVKDFSVKAS